MANKYRKSQVKVPYRRFKGKNTDPETELGKIEPEQGEIVYLGRSKKKASSAQDFPYGFDLKTAIPTKLPLELLFIVAKYVEDPVPLLQVSKYWHLAALSHVYRKPSLRPRNFPNFIESVTTHKELAALVQDLDLSQTVQVGKNSTTARMLKKCSSSLTRFVASQTHFGISPLMALRSCERLQVLDLSLVSETVDLVQLFIAIERLQDLEVMNFPRSSILCERFDFKWPPNLRSLGLAGGIAPDFLLETSFPPTITNLELSNCPFVNTRALLTALVNIGPQLRTLSVQYPMPLLSPNALDTVLVVCPNLQSLTVSIDYITSNFIDEDMIGIRPLKRLHINSTGMLGQTDKLRPLELFYATDVLPNLIRVAIATQLGWTAKIEGVEALAETLDERGGGLYVV